MSLAEGEVTKSLFFSYGHRLATHPGKCKTLHGHNARVDVTVAGPIDGATGMVIDFGDFTPLRKWLDATYDHKMLLHASDPIVPGLIQLELESRISLGLCLLEFPPTAENLARNILSNSRSLLGGPGSLGARVVRVQFWETAGSLASVGA